MNNNQSEIIDIKGLLGMCRRKWYYFVISALICGFFGFCFSLIIKPKYEVNASMQLQENNSFSSMISGGLSGVADIFGGNVDGEDEVQIVTSHTVLSQVIKELGINQQCRKRLRPLTYVLEYKNAPLEILPGNDMLVDTLRSQIMFRIKMHDNKHADIIAQAEGNTIFSASNKELPAVMTTDWGTFTLAPTENFDKVEAVKYRITLTSPSLAAVDLKELLSVGLAAKNSSIIEFQMFSANTEYAIDVVNAIMAKYILRSEKMRMEENNAMAQLLQQRIEQVSASLNEIEKEIATTGSTKNIANLAIGTNAVGERVAKAETSMQQSRITLEMAQLTLDMVKAAAADNNLIPLQGDNAIIAGQISSYNNAVLRRKQLEGSAKADNPALQRLDEQIASLRSNLIKSLELQLSQAAESNDKLTAIYNSVMAEMGEIPQFEYETRSVLRSRAIEEEIYIFLLKKQEETAMLMAKLDNNAIIIDPAYSTYEDMAMSKSLVIFIAIVFGLMLPPVWFYFRYGNASTSTKPEEEDED